MAEVEFAQWTTEGLMRHPVFKDLKDDKNPEEVIKEMPSKTTRIPYLVNSARAAEKSGPAKKNYMGKLSNLDKVFWIVEFKTVVKVALKAREVLDILGVKGFIKTSGSYGNAFIYPYWGKI